MTHPQVVGAVQHAAVGVAPAIDQIAVSLGSGHVHHRAVEPLGQKGLRSLRAKIAQVYHQGVAPGSPHILQGLQGVCFIFHGDGAVVQPLPVGLNHRLPAGGGQGDGKAVPGDCNDAKLHFWYVVEFHGDLPRFSKWICVIMNRKSRTSSPSWPAQRRQSQVEAARSEPGHRPDRRRRPGRTSSTAWLRQAGE